MKKQKIIIYDFDGVICDSVDVKTDAFVELYCLYNSDIVEKIKSIKTKLDKVILSCIKDKRFETVKIIKECKNGVTLKSDTYWDEDSLKWTYKNIESKNTFYFG